MKYIKHLPFLFLFPLFLLSCHDNEDNLFPMPGHKARRTVLVYMAAQNSLGRDGIQRADSLEIMNGRSFISPGDRLLVFIDDARVPRLYQVTAKEPRPLLIKQWAEDFSSTDPSRLREVLTLVADRFAAAEYGLVLWSHADGWIPPTDTDYTPSSAVRPLSYGIDCGTTDRLTNRGTQMSVEGVAEAVSGAGIRCKYIFFDACLMQNLEVGYALRGVADYLVAAPVATPGAGSHYTHTLASGLFSDNPADIASTYLADADPDGTNYDYADMGLAISCVRTDRLEALAAVLREALPRSLLAGRQSPAMQWTDGEGNVCAVLGYQAYTDYYYYRPHNYDALQALRRILLPADYQRAKAALDEAVVYHGATSRVYVGPGYRNFIYPPLATDDYRSVSMFIPQDVYTANAGRTRHGDLNESFRHTEWYQAAGFAATGW